jgi:hypothetical protein
MVYEYDYIEDWGFTSCTEYAFYYEPFSDCDDVVNLTQIDIISYVNDGIVTKESASNVPGLTYSRKMLGSNHFSMRNDLQTKFRLDELYEGDLGGFFTIMPR